MSKKTATDLGLRLAFRVEGDYWNAYFAKRDTMDDSVLLGSIRMSIVKASDERKEDFMNLMREAFSDVIQAGCDERPTWNEPERAPEHERAGRS